MVVNSFDLLKDEEEYEVLFPSVKEIVFSNAEIFSGALSTDSNIGFMDGYLRESQSAIYSLTLSRAFLNELRLSSSAFRRLLMYWSSTITSSE